MSTSSIHVIEIQDGEQQSLLENPDSPQPRLFFLLFQEIPGHAWVTIPMRVLGVPLGLIQWVMPRISELLFIKNNEQNQ